MKRNCIKHITPYHPALNGQADSIQTKLLRFLPSYRTTSHTTTGVPPAPLLTKRKPHTQLDLLLPNTHKRVLKKQSQQKFQHDYHAKDRNIQKEDTVYARDFRKKNTWIPGTIVRKTGPVSTEVELEDGTVIRRHQDHIRPRPNPEPTPPEATKDQNSVPANPVSTTSHDQLEQTERQPAAPPIQPVESSQIKTRPVRNRTRPQYLKDYVI